MIGHARAGMGYRNEFQTENYGPLTNHALFPEGCALSHMWYVEGPKVSHTTTSEITGMYLYVHSLGVGGRGPYTFNSVSGAIF